MADYGHLDSTRTSPGGGSPYGDHANNESTGYITAPAAGAKKGGVSKWIKIGVPVLILVIIGAVLGGVLGSRHHNSSSAASSSASGPSASAAASSAASAQKAVGMFATATNSEFMKPVYPSTTNSAAYSEPTFTEETSLTWPADPFKPSSPSATTVRTDRPRIIAPAYKWEALPSLIANNAYLSYWNETIFGNATEYFSQPPVVYFMDGGSGILDNCRDVKMRIKAFAYVYRMTNDTKWVDRAYAELQNAVSSSFGPSGPTKWNPAHFLDTAEMTAAFAIAYDWMYDAWSSTQLSTIRNNILTYGLNNGVSAYTVKSFNANWWKGADITGNWNCVCNSGLTLGALAILGDDTTGTAEEILGYTIPNAKEACAFGPSSDGTWAETANYWYFGTTAHAEMSSSLLSATGSDYGLLDTNTHFNLTGDYHMYASGPTSLFNYGDHGPNKYSTTANAMLYYASQFGVPRYALFQRDQYDAPEPWSMFWYDPSASGAFWDGAPLDRFFDNSTDLWGSMRSSWTDNNALYVAMKAGTLTGHQTHNDLDCGDFVLDAMGTRWAGELGSGDYNSPGYFTSDAQDAQRWLYYRKRTEGQNTILVNAANQNVLAAPTVKHGTTGEEQPGSTTVYTVPSNSTAYFTANLESAYFNTTSFQRGIRTINGRTQVLLQDEINASTAIMWRMHTNATVTIDSSGTNATLKLDGQTMIVQMLSPPSGAKFTTMDAVRLSTDPALPSGTSDQPNPGVTVLAIELPAGQYDLQVLFNPQWAGMAASAYKTPSFIPIDSWSTTSHP